jgi:hypothetical protein
MCTLTLLRGPWRDGWAGAPPRWRVVFSRDERRDRAIALPPEASIRDGVRHVAPIDPLSGGTWIAATSAGLVFALLNEAAPGRPVPRRSCESRGLVIPALAAARSRRAAVEALRALDVRRFPPFRLIVADAKAASECVADGRSVTLCGETCAARLMRTSSSVDTARVRAYRGALFARGVPHASRAAQDAFHAHRPADAPALGVSMSRADACTVSITTIDVFAGRAHIAYRPMAQSAAFGVTDLGVAS